MPTSPLRIVILEDDLDRRSAMLLRLKDRFPSYEVAFFNAVGPTIENLASTGLADVLAISLDHDLEMLPGAEGNWLDAGTGVEMAHWLAQCTPYCPIMIHTTNSRGGEIMVELLENSKWETTRIVPYEGTTWIDECWFPAMRLAILSNAKESVIAVSSELADKPARSVEEFPHLDVNLPGTFDPQRRS